MIVQYLPNEKDVPLDGLTPGMFYEGPISMLGKDKVISIELDSGARLKLYLLHYLVPIKE